MCIRDSIIDVLKLASLNTPDVLSNSFSMIGALILGDFAVQARWLVPEVLVYMAFVAIANYAQHSLSLIHIWKRSMPAPPPPWGRCASPACLRCCWSWDITTTMPMPAGCRTTSVSYTHLAPGRRPAVSGGHQG